MSNNFEKSDENFEITEVEAELEVEASGTVPPPPPPPPAAAPPAPAPVPTSAPAPTPPGYTPGAPAAAPAQPGSAPAAQPVPAAGQAPVAAPPSPFGMALGNLWHQMVDVWKGHVPQAYQRSTNLTQITGNKWLNWFIPFLANSLALGILISVWVSAADSGIGSLANGFFGSYSYMEFADYAKIFFGVALSLFGFQILRALAVMLAARTSGVSADFQSSATTVAVPATVWWLPIVVVALFWLLFPGIAATLLTLVGFAGVGLTVELGTYIGLTRLGKYTRSPLIPYSWFTVGAIILGIILFALMTEALV